MLFHFIASACSEMAQASQTPSEGTSLPTFGNLGDIPNLNDAPFPPPVRENDLPVPSFGRLEERDGSYIFIGSNSTLLPGLNAENPQDLNCVLALLQGMVNDRRIFEQVLHSGLLSPDIKEAKQGVKSCYRFFHPDKQQSKTEEVEKLPHAYCNMLLQATNVIGNSKHITSKTRTQMLSAIAYIHAVQIENAEREERYQRACDAWRQRCMASREQSPEEGVSVWNCDARVVQFRISVRVLYYNE